VVVPSLGFWCINRTLEIGNTGALYAIRTRSINVMHARTSIKQSYSPNRVNKEKAFYTHIGEEKQDLTTVKDPAFARMCYRVAVFFGII